MNPAATEQRVLVVTGANGFLGSGIVREALSGGIPLMATDRQEKSRLDGIRYCRADILNPSSLQQAFVNADRVIHAAGLAHVFGQPATAPFREINEIGTANVARAAVSAKVRHFLLVSSVSVYGPHAAVVVDETSPCRPDGPYAESKLRSEYQASTILGAAGIPVTILRLATLYGEGDPGNVQRLIRWVDSNRFVWIGSGSNRKSLLHRDDAARACLTAAQVCQPSGAAVFNVSESPCFVRELLVKIAASLGKRLPGWHVPACAARGLASAGIALTGKRSRIGAACVTAQKWLADDVYDGRRFEEEFHFQCRVRLSEGLAREVAWYRERARP